MTIDCPKCQADNPDNQKFCGKCGTQLSSAEKAQLSFTKTLETPSKGIVPGTTFASRYEIIEELGRGGMGVVYKAADTKLKRTVAIKILPPKLTGDKEAKERFIREAQSAAILDHPNICTIYEVDEAEEKTFISMAYVDGQNLQEKVKSGPLGINGCVDIAIQATEGLAAAHKKGIVHRDIKSANIMVTKLGQVKIMDFGLAKSAGAMEITKEGVTLGTVAYMSPEQAQGKAVDHRSDIWSLGVVLYEMFGGKLPFQGETEASYLYSIIHEDPAPQKQIDPSIPIEIQKVISIALKKKPEARYQSALKMADDLRQYQSKVKAEEAGLFNLQTLLRRLKQPKYAIPIFLVFALITSVFIFYFNRQAKIRWAKEQAIPEMVRLYEDRDYTAAFRLVKEAENFVRKESQLQEFLPMIVRYFSFKTNPSGAHISLYDETSKDWEYLGRSPIDKARTFRGYKRWRIEKDGFETIDGATLIQSSPIIEINLKLDKTNILPPGMVKIPGGEFRLRLVGLDHLEGLKMNEYYIDKFEVTNSEFKKFIYSGGYEKKEYWKHTFIKDGRILSWEKAISEFIDKTGRPGPSNWEMSDYPESEDNYPVTGISWYEAAAYAEFVEKSLPTVYHWDRAADIIAYNYTVPVSNFSGNGSSPVGRYQNLTSYGTYDMAGNVREWCWNEGGINRYILGGGWNDQIYFFNWAFSQPPFDRSLTNGFRCVKYLGEGESLGEAKEPIERPYRDFMNEEPITDEIFEIYMGMYAYDKTELNSIVESLDESAEDFRKEKISFDAAYSGERVVAYLFLPKKDPPPYQGIIYFPGSNAIRRRSSETNESLFFRNYDFIMRSGRALIFPLYKGTYERGDKLESSMPDDTKLYRDHVISWAQDLSRTIDYLETRDDIDTDKLAYYGLSMGGRMGGLMSVVENRFKTCVLNVAGLRFQKPLPEADPINFIPRLKIPVLMLNGRIDHYFPYETSQIPLYSLLGTPIEHKRHVVYETGHFVPKTQVIKEVLAWLDKYLGPMK